MITALVITGIFYVGCLYIFATRARKQSEKTTTGYLFAGANLGATLGIFTFAATLFSTFTLLGMPDFFRTHGVGAWIFLAIADIMMVFGIITIGYFVRQQAKDQEFQGMAGWIGRLYRMPFAAYLTFIGAFIFLIPYVAIQIRGVAIFLHAVFPEVLPVAGWAIGMVVLMVVYSETGGLKAIIYSDVLQGILLLIAIWVIGANCLIDMDGLSSMFQRVEAKEPALLSTPGPKGLFSFQFLVASAIAISVIPYTQPQVSTRIAIMKDTRSLFRMAIGLGVFAILVILPTLFIGMYGALFYANVPTAEFLENALVRDQPPVLAAIVIIGLIAAAISTADSQLFALGSELRSLMKGEDHRLLTITRVAIGFFALLALIFSLYSSDQLVLLARTSFAGTALMAPMILYAIFAPTYQSSAHILPILTAVGMGMFLLAQFNMSWMPTQLFNVRLDLCLLVILGALGIGLYVNAHSLYKKEDEKVKMEELI